MIEFLEGEIEELRENFAVIDVNGIGFGAHISANTYNALSAAGRRVRLYTYLNISENGAALFGFATLEEKEMFLILLSVNGIGAKTAVTMLGKAPLSRLKEAIASEDARALQALPGVGKKLAERMIVELKDKFKGMPVTVAAAENSEDSEALQALLALGFNFIKAHEAVREAKKALPDGAETETIIKEALKRLGK